MTRKMNLSCNGTVYQREDHCQAATGNNNNIVARSSDGHNDHDHNSWPCGDNVVGIVGPQTTAVSVQLANLGRTFRVPQVSYLATSKRLCNLKLFPYFFRTVPSDMYQVWTDARSKRCINLIMNY